MRLALYVPESCLSPCWTELTDSFVEDALVLHEYEVWQIRQLWLLASKCLNRDGSRWSSGLLMSRGPDEHISGPDELGAKCCAGVGKHRMVELVCGRSWSNFWLLSDHPDFLQFRRR